MAAVVVSIKVSLTQPLSLCRSLSRGYLLMRTLCMLSSYRGTSHIRNSASLGPYNRTMPRALWWS